MASAQDDILYYKQTEPESPIRRRGGIDLATAIMLIRHYPWPAPTHRDVPPQPGVLIGFVDTSQACFEFTGLSNGQFVLQLDLVKRRKWMRLIPYRKRVEYSAQTRDLQDVIALTRLFFLGRKAVMEDLFLGAIQNQRRQPGLQPAA